MTAPEAQAAAADLPTWGVWDDHRKEWLVTGQRDEREAWTALLEVESLHPWELSVKELPREDVATGEKYETCSSCHGDGDCLSCGQTCPECDGAGEVEAG